MTRASSIRKVDIKRAIEAVRAGGIKIARVEIEGGKVVIVSDAGKLEPEGDLDKWLAKHAN